MDLPRPRGPLSEAAIGRLRHGPAAELPELPERVDLPANPLADDDLQLTLWTLYELHYRGFDDLHGEPEWDPDLLGFRAALERAFEDALRAAAPRPEDSGEHDLEALAEGLATLTLPDTGDSMAAYLQREAGVGQLREFLMAKSVYALKESDAHSFVIPRLEPGPKAALVELQYDECGDGVPERVHQRLFARALAALDLDPTYGAYVDRVPGSVLAESNAMSLFGLHRRLRGASMGHLAAFEATSAVPSRLIARGIRRLELPEEVAAYYDEHVEADSVHEQVALRDICGRLLETEPGLYDDILLGAHACVLLADRAADDMRSAWAAGRSALLPAPVGEAA